MAQSETNTPIPQRSSTPGAPVEIGKIEKELKKLWERGGRGMTRASLINFAVYNEEPGSLEKNTQLLAQLAENHACRAIVIRADYSAKENNVEAWINAHCHLSRAGTMQICSEQISFLLSGNCAGLLPSIVFSHLDSDLPFYFWWQGELHDPMDQQLWAWVDRFIYDSHDWKNFQDQFRLVETAQQEAKQRIILCDLNWTRLDKIRYAIAQFFDHPASHHHFATMDSITVDYAPGFKPTAILLLGWLAAQLNWTTKQAKMNGSCRFLDERKRKVDIELRERGETPIGAVVLNSTETEFKVAPAKCDDLLEVSRSGQGEKAIPQMMPGPANDMASLISQELMRGGQHQVYLRAVNCVRDLL